MTTNDDNELRLLPVLPLEFEFPREFLEAHEQLERARQDWIREQYQRAHEREGLQADELDDWGEFMPSPREWKSREQIREMYPDPFRLAEINRGEGMDAADPAGLSHCARPERAS